MMISLPVALFDGFRRIRAVVAAGFGLTVLGLNPGLVRAAPHPVDAHDVVWTTPGKNAADSMPLGNGELGINLWIEENGDLLFYLGRNDSFSEVSQLCKPGQVRVKLSPNPFVSGQPIRQHLKLREGICEITAGRDASAVTLRVFVDAGAPVVHVLGESAHPVSVTARVESWRTEPQEVPDESAWTLAKGPQKIIQAADVFPAPGVDSVAWYHRNEHALAFEETVRVQSLESIRGTMWNPLLHRTFGGWVAGRGFRAGDARTLSTPGAVKAFHLRVASPCEQTPSADDWLKRAAALAAAAEDGPAALERTRAWWRTFWDRSWVRCETGAAPEVPVNGHPVRIGEDAAGGTRLDGEIGGLRVVDGVLGAEAVAAAARKPETTRPADIPVPVFSTGLSIDGWVRMNGNAPGRFLDKISVGGSDGFLLDSPGGNSLRMIVGPATLISAPGTLPSGRWVHVAGTYDLRSSAIVLYVDGKPVAGLPSTLSPTGATRHGLFHGQDKAADGIGEMTVGKAHTLQRYMQACAGRSIFPIKFNGSIFTVEPAALGINGNPDWRRWGDCHWWQNIRMPYHAMQASGDFDLMMPLFDSFERIRPFTEARAKLYHQAEGCYFAETMTVWGTYANRDYGWDRTGKQPKDVDCLYWRFAWNQGLEVVGLMLDYHDHTGDRVFLEKRLLPMAVSVLKYFDTRFKKDAGGRIILDPTQAVETYWHGVVNDTPTVAGLRDVTTRLMALPAGAASPEQHAFFSRMREASPDIPIEDAELDGKRVRRIAVAEKYDPKRSNVENPELFPIWPFRVFGLERPMLDEARHAYRLRGSHNDVGWGYDSNAAALLGMTDEAARILKVKIANSNAHYRWPATWGPNFDWLPDHCHGGNTMATIQYMLIQHSGEKILLFPAWPRDWNVSFKLHAPGNTTVEATLKNGAITAINVTPASRAKDVVLPEGWR